MTSSNPRLVGLWVAKYPGHKAAPVICFGCGLVVPPAMRVYRLRPGQGIEPYGREQIAGYLCRACRKALGPAHSARYFTKIEDGR